MPLKTAFPTETEGEGQEQEERVEKRKKRQTVATKAERTRTGTVTTMPFDVPGDAKSAICGLWTVVVCLCAMTLLLLDQFRWLPSTTAFSELALWMDGTFLFKEMQWNIEHGDSFGD